MNCADHFNALAERVVEHGFTVTPTKGKSPVVPRWQNPNPTKPEWLSQMVRRKRYKGHNLGIVCGRVVAIDIDADDPAKAMRIKALATEHLGFTAFQRVGRAPRILLLYRPADGEQIPSLAKVAGCVDVLSGGRQFVAFGIHPDTGRSYHWIDESPESAELNDVPVVTATSVSEFTQAVCAALGAKKEWTRSLHGEASSILDNRIVRNAEGLVVDGREAFMTKLTAAEFAKRTHNTPNQLGNRVWNLFAAGADLSRPKGSNPRKRWSLKDAIVKARIICRRNPDLRPPRRSRGGHPASSLHAFRKPGFWTPMQRKHHLSEVAQRISTPITLTVDRIMMEAVDLATGFCTMTIAAISARAKCSLKSVNVARAALRDAGVWIAGPKGTYVPVAGLNTCQAAEKANEKAGRDTHQVPLLYHPVSCSALSTLSTVVASPNNATSKTVMAGVKAYRRSPTRTI